MNESYIHKFYTVEIQSSLLKARDIRIKGGIKCRVKGMIATVISPTLLSLHMYINLV